MKLKKRLPVLFLALFLAFSPFLMSFPASASSDVLDGPSSSLSPGYHFDAYGYPDGLPLAYLDGVEVSQLGLPCVFMNAFGVWSIEIYTTPVVSVSIEQHDYAPDYTDVVIQFASDYKGYTLRLRDGVWVVGSPIDASADSFSLSASSGLSAYLNFPPDVVPDNWHFHEATVSLGSSGGPGVLSVFSGVGSWFGGAVNNMISMFYTVESGLSVLGVLAVASLALAVLLLLFYLLAGWLKFR